MAELIPTRPEWAGPDYRALSNVYFNRLEELDRILEKLEKTGRVVSFGCGDGYACYYVANFHPLQLEHIPAGDAYRIDAATIRGLTLEDLPNYGLTAKIPAKARLLSKVKPMTSREKKLVQMLEELVDRFGHNDSPEDLECLDRARKLLNKKR